MARPAKYDVLFEPVPIGPKTLKNRFYQTPHCTGFGDVFPGSQAHFRAMKAEGGWAAVNTEATSIAPEWDFAGQMTPSRLWDDDDIRNWSLMTEKVHEHGALAGIELLAGGAYITGFDSRMPGRHIHDRLEEAAWLGSVVVMTKRDIREVQQLYVAAARRARSAGFDIVNVHGGETGELPILFLMLLHNSRNDEYGGPIENRARFWLETLELVKEAVGDTCAITARHTIDTLHGTELGIRVEEEGRAFIELADHLVDFWDVQVGGENADLWSKDAGPSRFYPENFQAEWVRKIRPATNKPIVGVGRFTNPDTMVEVIRSGQIDIIGAARPSISDPFLPRKIEEGRFDEIRECIGCNVCVSRINAGWHLICTQNATAGEEYRRGWHPERFDRARNADKNVLVVGGGPAGMECAITLAKRGMRGVHLVEAESDLGGHVRWVSTLPGMGEWSKIVGYRKVQLSKLPNIEVILGMELDTDAVIEYGAELVVIATGARWRGDGMNGVTHRAVSGLDAALPYVLTPEQLVIEGKPLPGLRVLVYDAEGYFMGVSLAEKLARDGHEVALVTPMREAAPYMRFTGESVHMHPLLDELGVKVFTGCVLSHVSEDVLCGGVAQPGDHRQEWHVDAVVPVTQRMPNSALYTAVMSDEGRLADAGVEAVYRIGDCHAPRQQVADAIFDSQRLGREIDSDDPSSPRRYIRERRLIGSTDEVYDRILDVGDTSYMPSTVRG
jgi:dimethylamine/trimethylamine dehydrogenase